MVRVGQPRIVHYFFMYGGKQIAGAERWGVEE